ncbi:MAG: hypothetical protein GX558_07480 [Clostridiales bacterium]|nr:hypothetical protein [Clostridiales bacterium]
MDVKTMVTAALLCAVGIIIPMYSPIRILLEPASFTLASHVAIFIAMFISPLIAAIVSLGTTLGFFLGGFPIVIVARAATQIVFAVIGALILTKKPSILDALWPSLALSLLLGVIHGLGEVLAVTPFYLNSAMSAAYYGGGYIKTVVGLVGLGTIVHSMVDFAIAQLVWRPLKKTLK